MGVVLETVRREERREGGGEVGYRGNPAQNFIFAELGGADYHGRAFGGGRAGHFCSCFFEDRGHAR